jgi:DNA-binding transcriptional ArsR family regulator
MSIAALNWVKGMHKTRIKPTPRSVLREMADFADEQDECWPSVETLSNCTSLSERAVQEALRVLEAAGLITTFQRYRTSSRYRLNRQLDLSQPLKGAPSAPLRARVRRPAEKPLSEQHRLPSTSRKDDKGADGAPLAKPAGKGADSVDLRVQISSSKGAPAAPKPPENHQRTTRERGARPRPTPLPPDWQPGEAGEAYARRLGLDPTPLAVRFRKTFLAKGTRLADWSQRWALWCDEDAAEKAASATGARAAAAPAAARARDAQGLTASDRGFLAKWQAKIAAGEHPGQLEDLLTRVLTAEGQAELCRRKVATPLVPAHVPNILRGH